MIHASLKTVHVLAVIVWIGGMVATEGGIWVAIGA